MNDDGKIGRVFLLAGPRPRTHVFYFAAERCTFRGWSSDHTYLHLLRKPAGDVGYSDIMANFPKTSEPMFVGVFVPDGIPLEFVEDDLKLRFGPTARLKKRKRPFSLREMANDQAGWKGRLRAIAKRFP